MKKFKYVIVAAFSIILTACSGTPPQTNVALNSNIFNKSNLKVGFVYIDSSEKATTHIFGASCLLCYGVASTLTATLDTHLEKTINKDELINIKDIVLSEYSSHSSSISSIDLPTPIDKLKRFKGELGFAKKDFRELKESLDIDLLVVLNIYGHGAYRSFSSYIPNGDPQGYISGLLYSVDLNTNAYIQYLEIDEKIQPVGEWDEPTNDFPSVTTAYYQAIENAKKKIKDAI